MHYKDSLLTPSFSSPIFTILHLYPSPTSPIHAHSSHLLPKMLLLIHWSWNSITYLLCPNLPKSSPSLENGYWLQPYMEQSADPIVSYSYRYRLHFITYLCTLPLVNIISESNSHQLASLPSHHSLPNNSQSLTNSHTLICPRPLVPHIYWYSWFIPLWIVCTNLIACLGHICCVHIQHIVSSLFYYWSQKTVSGLLT